LLLDLCRKNTCGKEQKYETAQPTILQLYTLSEETPEVIGVIIILPWYYAAKKCINQRVLCCIIKRF
jgi:hypothetical protein